MTACEEAKMYNLKQHSIHLCALCGRPFQMQLYIIIYGSLFQLATLFAMHFILLFISSIWLLLSNRFLCLHLFSCFSSSIFPLLLSNSNSYAFVFYSIPKRQKKNVVTSILTFDVETKSPKI